MQLPHLSPEFAVKDLLKSFAPLAVGEYQVVVLDRAHRERRLPAGVTDDMPSEEAVRVKANIGLTQNEIGALRHAGPRQVPAG